MPGWVLGVSPLHVFDFHKKAFPPKYTAPPKAGAHTELP
jgi:hypothetical protein